MTWVIMSFLAPSAKVPVGVFVGVGVVCVCMFDEKEETCL